MTTKYLNRTRANNFDRRCGIIQTQKVIEFAVGDTILDVGCGVGEFTPMFRERFRKVVGLDPEKKFLEEARKANSGVFYIEGWGETFKLDEKFGTISMNNLLEHVDDPRALLINCKRHLAPGGRIIAQVPNSESMTRRLGVAMGIIDHLDNITKKERDFYGHQRVYTLASLEEDASRAGLRVVKSGGILYKPLPNEMLEILCLKYGETWARELISGLVKLGEGRPMECAYLFVICE